MTSTTSTTSTELEPVEPVRLTPTEVRALTLIEAFWHEHSRWPELDIPGFNLEQSMEKPFFIKGLANRGIPHPPAMVKRDALSNEQIAAILIVSDFGDKRSLNSKLKAIGISSQTWQGWMKDPMFKDYLHGLTTRNFEDSLHSAQQGLLASVEKGDVNAIKYWMQLTGREVSPEVQSARTMIARLIQVIQTHVKDESTLRKISKDFERVMRGDSVESSSVDMEF